MSDSLLEFIWRFPKGVSAGGIERHFKVSRTTLNRQLKEILQAGAITVTGKGPATRYHSADPLAAIRAYFARPHTDRVMAPYREELLDVDPGLRLESARLFDNVPSHALTRRELGKFLVDFSCASSALEGGTYSLLDTQALIEYGRKICR